MIKNSLNLDVINQYFIVVDSVLCWKIRKSTKTKIGNPAGYTFKRKNRTTQYIVVELNGKTYYTHRLLYQIYNDIFELPNNMLIDHIDKNGLNNRKENLRLVTESQNRMNINKISKNKGYKGVHWGKKENKWKVQIKHSGKNHYIGCYDNIIDAAKAYDTQAKIHHGEYASLNFP